MVLLLMMMMMILLLLRQQWRLVRVPKHDRRRLQVPLHHLCILLLKSIRNVSRPCALRRHPPEHPLWKL